MTEVIRKAAAATFFCKAMPRVRLGKMGRKCSTCQHIKRAEIDRRCGRTLVFIDELDTLLLDQDALDERQASRFSGQIGEARASQNAHMN